MSQRSVRFPQEEQGRTQVRVDSAAGRLPRRFIAGEAGAGGWFPLAIQLERCRVVPRRLHESTLHLCGRCHGEMRLHLLALVFPALGRRNHAAGEWLGEVGKRMHGVDRPQPGAELREDETLVEHGGECLDASEMALLLFGLLQLGQRIREHDADPRLELLEVAIGARRHAVEMAESRAEELRGLAIGQALVRLKSGQREVAHGLRVVAAAVEVRGELTRDAPQIAGEALLDSFSHALMESPPPSGGQAFVQRLAVERVSKPVRGGPCPVRPGLVADGAQQVAPRDQALASVLHRLHPRAPRPVECRGDARRPKLNGRDARCLEKLQLARIELGELDIDHFMQALRDVPQVVLVDGPGQLPPAAPLRDGAALHEMVDHGHEKERIALAPGVNPFGQRRREAGRGEAPQEIRPNLAAIERIEAEACASGVRPQGAGQRDDRVVIGDGLRRPVRAHDHEPRRVAPPRNRPEQVDRGGVGPVKILEHQHERSLGRHDLQCAPHLAQHAGARRVGDRYLETPYLLAAEQPRHLYQPGGSIAAQDVERVRMERANRSSASNAGM